MLTEDVTIYDLTDLHELWQNSFKPRDYLTQRMANPLNFELGDKLARMVKRIYSHRRLKNVEARLKK